MRRRRARFMGQTDRRTDRPQHWLMLHTVYRVGGIIKVGIVDKVMAAVRRFIKPAVTSCPYAIIQLQTVIHPQGLSIAVSGSCIRPEYRQRGHVISAIIDSRGLNRAVGLSCCLVRWQHTRGLVSFDTTSSPANRHRRSLLFPGSRVYIIRTGFNPNKFDLLTVRYVYVWKSTIRNQ